KSHKWLAPHLMVQLSGIAPSWSLLATGRYENSLLEEVYRQRYSVTAHHRNVNKKSPYCPIDNTVDQPNTSSVSRQPWHPAASSRWTAIHSTPFRERRTMNHLLPDHLRFNLGYLGADTARLEPDRIAVID